MKKREFWSKLGKGMAIVVIIVGLFGIIWAFNRHNHVAQIRYQAAFLSELSGHEGEPNTDRDRVFLQEIVRQTRTRFSEEPDPEASLRQLLSALGHSSAGGIVWGSSAQASSIHNLVLDRSGYISSAMTGNTEVAQILEAEWLADRHIKFWSYGLVLMFIFFFGQYLVIDDIVIKGQKQYFFVEEQLEGAHEAQTEFYERLEMAIEELKPHMSEDEMREKGILP